MSLHDGFLMNTIDHLACSNVAINFDGFYSNFYQLLRHGWDIRYHQDFNRDKTFFIFTKGECKLTLSFNNYRLRSIFDHYKKGIDLSFVNVCKENQYYIDSEQDFIECQQALLDYQSKKIKQKQIVQEEIEKIA